MCNTKTSLKDKCQNNQINWRKWVNKLSIDICENLSSYYL